MRRTTISHFSFLISHFLLQCHSPSSLVEDEEEEQRDEDGDAGREMVAGIEGIFLFLDSLIGSGVHDLIELIRDEAFIEIRKELGIAERFLTEEIKNRRVERYMIPFRKDGETARDDAFQPLIPFQRLFFHLGRNGIEDIVEMVHVLCLISRIQIRREEGLVADRTPRVCLFSEEGREGSLDLMDAFEHMKERRVVFRIVLQDILGDVEAKNDVV